jgi:hypothetical protein
MSQIQLPVGIYMNATDFSAVISDVHGAPTNVVRKEEEFGVDCEWYLQGPNAPTVNVTWHLRVALESIGPGPDFVVPMPSHTIHYGGGTVSGTAPNQRVSFSDKIALDGQTLLPNGAERAYHLTALLTSRDQFGQRSTYAAIYDLGLLEVIDSDLP